MKKWQGLHLYIFALNCDKYKKMKRQLYSIILACVALALGAAAFPAQQKNGTKKTFNVTIEQNVVQQKTERY